MKTIHWNGEHWYVNERSLLRRIRQWFIWLGGWEKANGAGWSLFRDDGKLKEPSPISVFGHRATLFHLWGGRTWGDVRIWGTWLHLSRDRGYLSDDGTPQHERS